MATCRECLHFCVCKLRKNVICTVKDVIYKEYQTLPNIENVCGEFIPESDYVKLERGEWISVKDRLPKQDKLVLCYNIQRPKREPFIGRYLGGSYSEAVYAFLSVHRGCSVGATHWQPLPEPPKGV